MTFDINKAKHAEALESAEYDFAQELTDEEWIYEDSYYNAMIREFEHATDTEKPSGVVVNGFELTIGQLREYNSYGAMDNDDAYLEELEEDFRVDDLGVDPNDEEIYDGGFHRTVKSKREFS